MDWQDEGIILATRPFGETSLIVDLMTAAHGRHSGLVRGGRSKRLRPLLQPGTSVAAVWQARLEDSLGSYRLEATETRTAALIESAPALFGLELVAALLHALPERAPHGRLYGALALVVDHLAEPLAGAELIARFELLFLEEMGFGLDLATCAATGATTELIHVSPKSGRAVSREAGLPYADRLLALPAFLTDPGLRADAPALADAFRLTGHFLARHVFPPPEALPPARDRYLSALSGAAGLRAGPDPVT